MYEVFSLRGPSNVIPASLDPKRKLPENLSVFGFFWVNDKTPDKALSYSAPKEDVDRVTSLIKEIFTNPTGPPELPWVEKWLIFGISIPSR